jgi:signal transduction histidine kinase
MEQRVLESVRVEQPDSCDWRQVALGIAALVANTREPREDMLSELVHHLRPPMAALRASAVRLEAAAAERSGAGAARDLTACIVDQTDLMARWVGAILDVQRIHLGKVRLDIREVDLVDIARRCAADFHATHRDVDVRVVPSGPPVVKADAGRLSQVINTVLSAMANIDCCHEVALRIGPGVWPAHKPESKLDLELFVAREIVRLHGGELWAETDVNGQASASIIIVLPAQFPPLSHTILATNARCFEPA